MITPRALLLLAALGAGVALAGEEEAQTCLRNLIWEGYKEGWSVRTASSTTLGLEEFRVFAVTLYAGSQYHLLACGDAAATQVGLALYDADGAVLAQAPPAGVQPVLDYVPTATATYYVSVRADAVAQPGARAGVGMAVTYR